MSPQRIGKSSAISRELDLIHEKLQMQAVGLFGQ